MRARIAVLTAAVAALTVALAGSASAGVPGFAYGVGASDVGTSSAILWTRSDTTGLVTVQIARNPRFRPLLRQGMLNARASADRTVQTRVTRLSPNTRFYYRFLKGMRRSEIGTLRTAPLPTQNQTIRFAFSGDLDAQRAKGQSQPFYNNHGDRNFAVYAAMVRENNHFNLNFGDTIYSDSEVGEDQFSGGVYLGFPLARTLAQKWAKYRQNLALTNLQRLRRTAGVYHHWDDHEFINDFARNELLEAENALGQKFFVRGSSIYPAGVAAFRHYQPVTYTSRDGIYRSFRWGRNLEIFMLDQRSFRSAKAGSPSVQTCNNPQTGRPDLAPTAPQSKRNLFAFIVPSLAQPVRPECLAAIRSPNRTMLGARQFQRFTNAIARSTARWKVIMNEVPIQQFFYLPFDRWEGYEFERQRLLNFLRNRVKNVVFLTTDVHASFVNDARFATFPEEGGPRNSGILDVTTGPVATMTQGRELNNVVGQNRDTGNADDLVHDSFLRPQPPNGVGMRCAAMNTFSYGQVTVTATRLRLQLKNLNRQPVRDDVGTNRLTCPTIDLNYRP